MRALSVAVKPLVIALSLVVSGCAVRLAVPDDAAHREEGARIADEAVAAHGGMEAWRAIGGVRMHLHTEGPMSVYPADTDWILDPARNRGVMRWTEHGLPYEYRYDGTQAWIVEAGRCVQSKKRRATAASRVNNMLFWFGVPWKFRDPGAIVRSVPPLPMQAGARPSPRYYVSYTVGDTPQDWFLVWLDPDTRRIARIEYVASEFSRAIVIVGRWLSYEELGGLALVTRREHRPQSRLLRALAKPFVQTVSGIEIHQPLEDALFAEPEPCRPPPTPPASKAARAPIPIEVEADVVLPGGADRIFALATDPARVPAWQDADSTIEWLSTPALAVGSRIRFRSELFGRRFAFVFEVTALEPGRRLVLRSVESASSIELVYTFSAEDEAHTRMRVGLRGQIAAGKGTGPLLTSVLRRALRANLARFRALVEADAATQG